MNTTSTLTLLALVLAPVAATAQETPVAAPEAQAPQQQAPDRESPDRDQEGWSEGFGRAPSYRSALAHALEDAVARQKGVAIARGPSIRSRFAVVSDHKDGEQPGFFDGESEREREWVQQQVAGFVRSYEVVEKGRAEDRMWEVKVRALVAGLAQLESELVVELVDNDLRSWQLERYEEGGPGQAFDRRKGSFQGPKIGEYLRRSGAVKVANDGRAVRAGAEAAREQREKAGQQLVASHRVVIDWKPLLVSSMVEKPNKARPRRGPRPEYMSGGVVEVTLRIEDLVKGVVLLDESFAVPAEQPGSWSVDRLDAFVTALVDKAKAEVAKKVFFTLRPPVVLRKWVGEGSAWFVEARVSKRVAAAFRKFSVGNNGSLADPDWQPLGAAAYVGGSALSSTFRLEPNAEVARIEPDVSEVRPIQ